ncbi:MAG: hypothetical protein JSV65_14915 [Armatimonadota bacterium]|nr:MAG: hypothetical protein JSV65_14915 [Armatimonadota bacterium]
MYHTADCGLALILILMLAVSTSSAAEIDLSRAAVVAVSPGTVPAKAAAMVSDEIEKRTRLTLEIVSAIPGGERPLIAIGTARDLASKGLNPPSGLEVPQRPDGYALWVEGGRRRSATICVAGYDNRGALFGAGRLLRLLEMGRDKLALDEGVKLATAPHTPLRGHQFGYRPKTNSYDGWTLAMWEQYYRDMVVFGMNAIELIPPRSDDASDSPHFPKPQMEMMISMSRLADEYGLDVWIWYPAIDGDYTDAATVQAALNDREEVFEKLPRVDAVFVPGGDPGDTRPDILLVLMEKTKQVLNRYHPEAQIWVSPQGFDRPGRDRVGWLKMFIDILQTQQPEWLDGVVFGPQVEMSLPELRKAVPARYPIRRYPDITHSMSCQYPVPGWDPAFRRTEGREPINPRPMGYAKIFRDLQPYSYGYITYSEGCNDDVNKVVWSCLGWDPAMSVADILREYSRYFISPRFEDRFAQGLLGLEEDWEGPLLENQAVGKTLGVFQAMEREATPQERLNWRFQQGLYRAYYDAYIQRRLVRETNVERRALEDLKSAPQVGADAALDKAEATLDQASADPVATYWRARVFEMAEALFQSIRMQLSVERYKAIHVSRGANLDAIDTPFTRASWLREEFDRIRGLGSEQQRLEAIAKIAD